MAFLRNQYDTSFGSDFTQRPQGSITTSVQHNLAPVTYPWQCTGGYPNQTSGSEFQNLSSGQGSYGQTDFNFGYGSDYNKGNSTQNFNEGNINQDYNKSSYDQGFNKGNFGLDLNKEGSFGQDFTKGDNYGQDFNKGGNYTQDFNKGGNYTQNFNKGGNIGQDFNKGGNYGQDFNKGGNYGQDFNKGGNYTQNFNKGGNIGQDFNKGGNYVQDFNKGGDFGQDFNKGGNFGQDFNKGNFKQRFGDGNYGQDYNDGNYGQDFNDGNYGQDYNDGNYGQDYNEGNYEKNYSEGNFEQNYNEDNHKQGYNEGNYSQNYNEGIYNQDPGAGFDYDSGDGFGNDWQGGETGSGFPWRGRGRGMGAGSISARGFPSSARGGGSLLRGGRITGYGNEKMANSRNLPSLFSNSTKFSRGSSSVARGGKKEGRGRRGGGDKGPAKSVVLKTDFSLQPNDAPIQSTDIKKTEPSLDESSEAASKAVEEEGPPAALDVLITRWQAFAATFTDCGNAISNLECSLKASKVTHLELSYECNFLTKCSNYSIYTGVLHFKKLNSDPEEKVFVARGYGMNKKTAKMDCYEKAYNLFLASNVETLMSQVDSGETVLRQELHHQYRQDPDGFIDALKKSNAVDDYPPTEKELAAKRRASLPIRPSRAKRSRLFFENTNEKIEGKNVSLAPTKKVDMVMDPEDDLIDKLYTLKQLLREEGITRLHIVPKIDQLAHRCAIHIINVYRFEEVPVYGFEIRMPVYCEIYFDDVLMARSTPQFKRNVAMQKAYNNLSSLLCMRNLEHLVESPRFWHPYMAMDPKISDIITKLKGRDNDSILTSNLANMKQMMQSSPDVNLPVEQMVLTEHESDKDIENVFKSLELSATRNLMLLECEITRNTDMTFTCSLSLQGRVIATRVHATKNGAKRMCSEHIMRKLKLSHDIVYVKTELVGRVITQDELLVAAAKKKALGEPGAKIFKKIDHQEESALLTPGERDNVSARPLFPWIAAAVYDILDKFYTDITLEDLMLDIGDMPKSQRDIVSTCAIKMGLRMVTKTKTSFDGPILRRTVTAQDMCKILQLHGGESGRYKLTSCKNPLSKEGLDEFRSKCLEHHQKLVDARTNDNPDEDPEPASLKSQFAPGDIYKKPSSSRARRRNPPRGASRAPFRAFRGLPIPDDRYLDDRYSGDRYLDDGYLDDEYLDEEYPDEECPDDRYFSGPPMFPGKRFSRGAPRPLMGSRVRPVPDSFAFRRGLYDSY